MRQRKTYSFLRVFGTKNRVFLRSESVTAIDILNHADLRESSPTIYFLKIHNGCGVISVLDSSGLCLFFFSFLPDFSSNTPFPDVRVMFKSRMGSH